MAIAVTFLAYLEQKTSLAVENLHPEVSSVGNKNFALRRYGDVPRTVKLSVGVSVASECEHRVAVDVEDVDSMVVAIGDEDTIFRVNGDATGSFDLSLTSSFTTELTDKLSIFGKNLIRNVTTN